MNEIKSNELRELLGLEPVSLVIKRADWDGLDVELKDDDWVKRCVAWRGKLKELDSGYAWRRPGGIKLRMM